MLLLFALKGVVNIFILKVGFILKLSKILKETGFPENLMDVKFLCVPKAGFKRGVIHGQLVQCSALSGSSSLTEEYYENLEQNFYDSRDLFENISFNEFLANEEKYCSVCSSQIPVTNPSDFSVWSLEAESFIKSINDKISMTLPGATLKRNWKLFNDFFKHEELMTSFKELESLNVSFRERLHADVFGVETPELAKDVKVQLWSFMKDSVFKKIQSGKASLLSDVVKDLESTFMAKIPEDEKFVVFNFSILPDYLLDRLVSHDAFNPVLSKIIFGRDFIPGRFSVLPYVEFETLKVLFAQVLFYHDDNILNNFAICDEKPTREVLDTMRTLFDAGNSTMCDYETLYNIAFNV